MRERSRLIRYAVTGALLGSLTYASLLAIHFSLNPFPNPIKHGNEVCLVFDEPEKFNQILAEMFPNAPALQERYRSLYYQLGWLQALKLKGETVAYRLLLFALFGTSCGLALEARRFHQTQASIRVT